MPLLKHSNKIVATDRGNVYTNRANVDGMAFRLSSQAGKPLYTEEEISRFAEPVRDFDVDVFNLRDPEQRKRYKEILDGALDGLYEILLKTKPQYIPETGEILVVLEWALVCLEMRKN